MIQLLTAAAVAEKYRWEKPIPCAECGKESAHILAAGNPKYHPDLIAMCQQCMIKVEAMLRGARKRGPSPGQWGGDK